MDLLEQSILLIISFFANLLSALAGGGAGLLQLPALIFLGLPFSTALATHKIASVALGIGATLKHSQQKTTELRYLALLFFSGIPGVYIGAQTILNVPEQSAKIALGVLTTSLGLYSAVKKQLGQHHQPKNRSPKGLIIGAVGLFIIGFLNGSLTSGTGLFVTLWLTLWFGFDYKRATAYTLIIVGLFWNGSGALTLALQTRPRWEWLPTLFMASLVGGYWGAHLGIKFGNPIIKRCFEGITIMTGLSLIIHALK